MNEVEEAKHLLLGEHQCYECGKWGSDFNGVWHEFHNKNEGVKWVNDPYAEEIEETIVKKWFCYECYHKRELEI